MNWRLATTEAEHAAVARLLNARRREVGGDPEGNLKDRDDTEEWVLGSPPIGVAVFAHEHDKWVLERIWVVRGQRKSGFASSAVEDQWKKRYGKVGIRQPHESMRAMLRRRGWGPELRDDLAHVGLAEPGEAEPFEHDDVWVRHAQKRG